MGQGEWIFERAQRYTYDLIAAAMGQAFSVLPSKLPCTTITLCSDLCHRQAWSPLVATCDPLPVHRYRDIGTHGITKKV